MVDSDAAGNLVAAGKFSGTTDFDIGPGVSTLSTSETNAVFIARYSPSNQLLWARKIEPAQPNGGSLLLHGVHVDGAGATIIFGAVLGTVDMDPGRDVHNIVELNLANGFGGGDYDGFIAKYDANGAYQWAFVIGTPRPGCGQGCPDFWVSDVATDASNNVFVTGTFENNFWFSCDFDPGPGVANRPSFSVGDVYLAKYSSAGDFIDAITFGGPVDDFPSGIEMNAADTLTVTGAFTGTVDFDAGPGTTTLTANGFNTDPFAARYDTSLNLIWAKGGSGSIWNESYSRCVSDAAGNYYMISTIVDAGTQVDFDPGPGVAQFTGLGSGDIVLLKFNALGAFIWAKHLGTPQYEGALDVQVDAAGNPWFVFQFYGTLDLDPGAGSTIINGNNAGHAVVKFSPAGELLETYNYTGTDFANEYGVTGLHFRNDSTLLVNGRVIGTADVDPGTAAAMVTCSNPPVGNPFPSYYPEWALTTLVGGNSPIAGDVNGDGQVNVTDLLAVIGAWGTCQPAPSQCPADFNDDGVVNVTDLLTVVGNWG